MKQRNTNYEILVVCTRCNNTFYKSKSSIREKQKSFYCSKECIKKPKEERNAARKNNSAKWRKNNPEKVKKQRSEWRSKNLDRIKEYKKKYHQKYKDKIAIKAKQNYQKQKIKNKELGINPYKKNPEYYRKRAKEYRENNPEIIKRQREQHRKNNMPSLIWSRIKKAAKNHQVDFDLTKEWIKERLDGGVCEMSGIAFDMEGKRTINSPSVDRIIPGGPYTKDNCRIILWAINRALSNVGEDYMLEIFRKIISKKDNSG